MQITGKKKWTLYPPSLHRSLYLFPFLHPHHAQSQVDLSNPSATLFKKFKDAKPQTVVVSPGEILYLPPLYFHEVEALEASININSWTMSYQTVLICNFLTLAYNEKSQ